jgi:hypothetical protein
MNVKSIFGAALLWSALAGAVSAENARLPYSRLYQAQKAQADWNRAHTNILVVLTMQSIQPDVKTSDLSIYIGSKTGKIPVEIRPEGDFMIPMRDDLLAEDPWIITNQPKGTMRLNWRLGLIPGHLEHSFRYGRLMRPVQESEDIQEQMRRILPGSPALITTGLKLKFAREQKKATVIIHAKGGDRTLTADDRGEAILPLSPDLLEEDPEVSVSDIPGTVEIVTRPGRD